MYYVVVSRIKGDPNPYHLCLDDFAGKSRIVGLFPIREEAERARELFQKTATVMLAVRSA